MTPITIYIDPATEERLRLVAAETDRRLEDLAESAVSEHVLAYFRHRADDPGRDMKRATSSMRRAAMEAAL